MILVLEAYLRRTNKQISSRCSVGRLGEPNGVESVDHMLGSVSLTIQSLRSGDLSRAWIRDRMGDRTSLWPNEVRDMVHGVITISPEGCVGTAWPSLAIACSASA